MFKKKIKVLIYLNHDSDRKNACTLYRCILPFKYLRKFKVRYSNEVQTTFDYNPISKKVRSVSLKLDLVEWADVVVFARHYDQVSIMGMVAEAAKNMGKTIVYETDDLLHRVGQNLGGGGKKGADEMDRQLKMIDWLLPHVDLLTVSTDSLKEFYSKKTEKPIFVLPNCFDPAAWRFLYVYKKLRDFWRKKIMKDDTIRIGWQGGNNHFLNNFNYIVDPLNEIAKKYGKKIQFVAMAGQHPNIDIYGNLGAKRKFLNFDFEYRKPVPVMSFPRALAEMDLDVGLIVVEDSEFSRAKSNIKWMEYGLLGVPAVSSNVLPYQDTNAVLVDNSYEAWVGAIESLVNNEHKRAIIGAKARKMALGLSIKKHAWRWEKAYRDALSGALLEPKVGYASYSNKP